MQKIFSIPVQKLFLVTLVLKVASSGIGWLIHDPWVFGLAIPLALMASYILLGWKRVESTVTDEKFADSCYYIGFIFTITSIVFGLLDLPNIGTRMPLIAARFGTAMISTVLGLVVRVYWVSFRQDVADAVQAAEEGVIEASHRLREQLTIVLEKFRDFESQVDDATSQSIAKVNVGVAELTSSYGKKLTEFFDQLASDNAKAFKSSQSDVHEASLRLSRSVDGYSAEMKKSLKSIETRIVHFSDVVTHRLEKTTFPDDYFAQRLAEPLSKLGESTTAIATTVNRAAGDINQSLETVRGTFAAMREHADDVESVLERVAQLATTQEALLAGSKAQVDTLRALNSTFRATQESFDTLSSGVTSQKDVLVACTKAVAEQIGGVERVVTTLRALDTSLSTISADARLQHETLAAACAGAAEQTAALGQVNENIGGLTQTLGQVAGAIGHNSRDLVELAHHVTQENAKAQETRATTLNAAQRIEMATQDLPHVREAAYAMSQQLGGLVLEMKAFTADVSALIAKVASREAQQVHHAAAGSLGGATGHANGSGHDGQAWRADAPAPYPPAIDGLRT